MSSGDGDLFLTIALVWTLLGLSVDGEPRSSTNKCSWKDSIKFFLGQPCLDLLGGGGALGAAGHSIFFAAFWGVTVEDIMKTDDDLTNTPHIYRFFDHVTDHMTVTMEMDL